MYFQLQLSKPAIPIVLSVWTGTCWGWRNNADKH